MTVRFIRLEAVAKMTEVINDLAIVVIVVLAYRKILMALIIMRALLMVTFDSILVGQFDLSLDLGVIGVGWTNIAVGLTMLVPSLYVLIALKLIAWPTRIGQGPWMSEWLKIALRSGAESAVRNLAFALMILRMVNEVGEAGLFWVTNGFIWGWLLLPVLALGTLVRRDAGISGEIPAHRMNGYFSLMLVIGLIWIVTIPAWHWFASTVLGSGEAHRIVSLALLSLAFYVVFALNHVLDSYFYGTGRTLLLLYQSVATSVLYYGAAFVAYLTGYFSPTLTGIIMLFGFGIVFDSALTLAQYVRIRRQTIT